MILKVKEDPQYFHPREEYQTISCTKGTSLILVGYSVRESAQLKPEEAEFLKGLDFDWNPRRIEEPKRDLGQGDWP